MVTNEQDRIERGAGRDRITGGSKMQEPHPTDAEIMALWRSKSRYPEANGNLCGFVREALVEWPSPPAEETPKLTMDHIRFAADKALGSPRCSHGVPMYTHCAECLRAQTVPEFDPTDDERVRKVVEAALEWQLTRPREFDVGTPSDQLWLAANALRLPKPSVCKVCGQVKP